MSWSRRGDERSRPDVEFIVFVIRDEFGSSVKNGDEVSMRNLVKKTSNPMRVGGIDDDIAVEQLRKAGMLLVFLDYASVLCLCGERGFVADRFATFFATSTFGLPTSSAVAP